MAAFLRFAAVGDRAAAYQALTELTPRHLNDLQGPVHLAQGYALLGDLDKAIEMLELAVDHGFIAYPYLSDYDQLLQPLWAEPAGKALLARVKREWEAFEV